VGVSVDKAGQQKLVVGIELYAIWAHCRQLFADGSDPLPFNADICSLVAGGGGNQHIAQKVAHGQQSKELFFSSHFAVPRQKGRKAPNTLPGRFP
jgi:hypothetical protein